MSEKYSPEDFGVDDWARGKSGIYRLGFDPGSVVGFLFPGAFVTAVGGLLGFIIWKYL